MIVTNRTVLKDYSVFNPDFYQDVIKFMDLGCTKAEAQKQIEEVDRTNPLSAAQIQAGELTLKERLNALVDRIEFLGHLELVSNLAIKSEFILLGQEVRGIHWDIKALRLYLALTCIDIFCEKGDHRSHFETVFSQASDRIKKVLDNSLLLRKGDGTKGDMGDIGLFFYNVRNFYTHAGKRFHILEGLPLQQESPFVSGSKRNKEEQCLTVAEGVKLVNLLVLIAISTAKRRFGWQSD